MSSSNPAALQGWVKSKDPKSGRVFYANHVTRSTQWDPPSGWVEEEAPPPPPPPPPPPEDTSPLPANWEVMHDPSTGKPFYVNHSTKTTTWTRPTAEDNNDGRPSMPDRSSSQPLLPKSSLYPSMSSSSYKPSTTTSSVARAPQRSYSSNSRSTTWQQPAVSYTMSHHLEDTDFSDALPNLDFRVKKVPDKLHDACPSCGTLFTYSLRRHHCRLCGDVFCDKCSTHRVDLPLDGPEFEKPVRVCDLCFKDVDKGNFFSMRRYLTPLQLFDGREVDDDDEEGGVATAKNVCAALCSLTADLDSLLHNSSEFKEKVTIPPDVLVPAIIKHLELRSTSNRAVRALASLLALGSIVLKNDYAHLVYMKGSKQVLDAILTVLERSGSDRKTLYVQEQAARAIFYLTDSSVTTSLVAKQSNSRDDDEDEGSVDSLDIQRALRSMLDHVSVSKNPALQRWAAACIRNLITEDQRRTCIAINDVAAAIASGEEHSGAVDYESFLPQLVSTGGIMILCSVIGADDPDTRAHATGALSATISSTRAIDSGLATLSEMTGGRAGSMETKDGDIVRAIVNGGGCGSSLSQLLLSAENAVVSMGCSFAASLVTPLLTDPRGSATLPSGYDPAHDSDGLGACREAALEMTSGGCLPALMSVVRDAELGGRISRPMELKKCAMETLAAIVFAVGQMGKSLSEGSYEDGFALSSSPAASRVADAVATLNKEGIVQVAMALLESSSSQSLLSNRDTPSSRIREAAGMVLASMTSCSSEAIETLQSMNAVSIMLNSSSDPGAATLSTFRGDGAPRCAGMLETSAAIIMYEWKHDSPKLLDQLLEAIDAGAISTVSRILASPLDLDSQDKAVGAMKARDACCMILCALFGVARTDETGIGLTRLYNMVDADSHTYSRKGKSSKNTPKDVITTALWILQASASQARTELVSGSKGPHYNAALMDLVESSLLCAGSLCGSSVVPGADKGVLFKVEDSEKDEKFKDRQQATCSISCDVLVYGTRQRQAVLPTMLVGGFGEKSVAAALRLALAVAQNGTPKEHAKLAASGILIPINDMLRNALTGGDLFKFSASLALIRFCGPHIAAGEGNGLQSVRESIRVATNVLTLPVDPNATMKQIETQEALKSECISALESLSRNASLWNAISKDALPAVVSYLRTSGSLGLASECQRETRLAALRAVQRIIQLPSHTLSAAQAGLAEPLANIIASNASKQDDRDKDDDDVLVRALEVLHVIARNADARKAAHLLECGALAGVCCTVGSSATDDPDQPTDSRADMTFLGLEIIHAVLSDIERSLDTPVLLQSPAAAAFVEAMTYDARFPRALCATLLVKTNMKVPTSGNDSEDPVELKIARLYGPQLVHVDEKCAGFSDTQEASNVLLFSIAAYCCAIESSHSDKFWNLFFLQEGADDVDTEEREKVSSVLCAHFLNLLSLDEESPFVPINPKKKQDFTRILRPLVNHRLLDGLRENVGEGEAPPVLSPMYDKDSYMLAVLKGFRIPQLCLSLCSDSTQLDPAYGMLKVMMDEYADDIPSLFIDSKPTIMALFDLLNLEDSEDVDTATVDEIRRTVASMLGMLAEHGLLAEAVERLGVRSSAIAALAAACLADDEKSIGEHHDDEEELPSTSARMSSRCMQCMVELCSTEKQTDGSSVKIMKLSSDEAEAIAKKLGKKICHMVISRFLERAKLEQYELEDDESVIDSPDVRMICAVSQHEAALKVLCSQGGLNALGLIAAEGELSAIEAMQKACRDDPTMVLQVDGHLSVMDLFTEEKLDMPWRGSDEKSRKIEEAAFALLKDLCVSSPKAKKAIANAQQCESCISRASEIIRAMVPSTATAIGPPEVSDEEEEEEPDVEEEKDEIPEAADAGDDESQESSEDVAERASKTTDKTNVTAKKETEVEKDADLDELVEVKDPSLEIGAYAFLSELALSKKCIEAVLDDSGLIRASTVLASKSTQLGVQYAATSFLVKISPVVVSSDDGSVPPAALADVFHSILKDTASTKSKNLKKPKQKNATKEASLDLSPHLLQSKAVDGVEAVFDCLDADAQYALLHDISTRFVKQINNVTVGRTSESDRSHGGRLACNLSMMIVLARGKDSVHNVLLNSDLVLSMVRLIQWHFDTKLTAQYKTDVHWKATVTQCLLFLSLVTRNAKVLEEAGVSANKLVGATLMVSRPGKAPRKAPDFATALRRAMEGGDAANAVAAEKILNRIGQHD